MVNEIQMTKVEREKEKERRAAQELHAPMPLPKNINDMKTYAFGKFTWRDVIVSGACLLVPNLIMLAFQALIPTWVCVVIGTIIGIPLVIIANKHLFTGDLPIEDKIKIGIKDMGENNLLSWDKTKRDGKYIAASTQSFVPDVTFTDDDYVMLAMNQGGFAVIQVDVEDSTIAKPSEQLNILRGFHTMLNQCIDNQKCIPIQIFMQATLTPLQGWIDNSFDDINQITSEGKRVMRDRAIDYMALLYNFDTQVRYSYRYYVIVTYREDAEGVGDSTMNTTSVRREQMKEKVNPFRKQMEAAESIDFKIGDDRAKVSKEFRQASEFGQARTKAELDNRVQKIVNAIDAMGATHVSIHAEQMDKAATARLFYEFFNETDKYTSVPVLLQAIDNKTALWSESVYDDFPDLFHKPNDKPNVYDVMSNRDSLRKSQQKLSAYE